MAKNSNSRKDQEAKEGLDTVKNDVPENRMQSDQQIQNTDDALKTEVPGSSFQMKKDELKGAKLKQEKVSDLVSGNNSASGMGINFAGRSVSGTANGVLGSNNSTPVAGKSRSDTRTGKKLDRLATKLNYTPCETTLIAIDESKPLAESADKDQGFNGTYRNEFGRSQKIMGAVPADLMFQRSVDLILKDKLYFLEGQAVFQTGDNRDDYYPSQSYDEEAVDYHDYEMSYGDYLTQALHVDLYNNGKVRYLYYDVVDVTPSAQPAEIVNSASAHRLIKSNTAELDRINIDAKAGDEKAEIWTPMARAYKEPTKISFYNSSIEAEVGGYVHLAYSKATTNFAFQLNRAVKDGINEVAPAIENCVGWQDTTNNSISMASAYGNSLANVFTTDMYAGGCPSLMIAAYDTIGKYNNKADLLLQPRGWRMHLQTADNNMNAFKLPKEYANVFAGQECFSTIDHEYDPNMPICMTDKANLIIAHDLNVDGAFVKPNIDFTIAYTNVESTYTYNEITLIPKYFLTHCRYDNLYVYVKQSSDSADGLVFTSGVITVDPDNSNQNVTYNVRISTKVEDTTTATSEFYGYDLLQTIVVASATYGLSIRIPKVQDTSTKVTASSYDLLQHQAPLYYKNGGPLAVHYSDLRNNYTVIEKHPLTFGFVEYLENSIGAKMKSLLKDHELYVPFIFSTQHMTLAQLFICAATPWITRVRMNSMKDVIYYEDNVKEYPYSKLDSIRNVPFKNYVNFGFTGYDEPLEVKVMQPTVSVQWILPEFFWKVDTYTYVCPWYCNENEVTATGADYDASAMSYPSIRSGVRLATLDTLYGMSEKDTRLSLDRIGKDMYDLALITGRNVYKYGRMTDGQPVLTLSNVITLLDVLSFTRELGLCFDAPLGVLTKDINDSGNYKALGAEGIYTSFRIKVWVNNNTIKEPTILNANGVNVNRAANFTQKWFELSANADNDNTAIAGLVFGLNDELDDGEYSPFADLNTGAQSAGMPTIKSFQRSMWTRLQLLPFVISPFDAMQSTTDNHDIYDIAYMFGLCGFRASDYRESVYNREKEVVNQGMLFVEDPWVIDSPILTHASKETGIVEGNGYKI